MDAPSLEPGETLRLHVPDVRGAIGRSGLSYRMTASTPLVQDIDLFITDRRVIVRAELFLGLFDADYLAWFPSATAPAAGDILRQATLDNGGLLGPSLTLVAEVSRPSVWRGPEQRLQLFFPTAADALAALPALKG
jgi:hypothetical protein